MICDGHFMIPYTLVTSSLYDILSRFTEIMLVVCLLSHFMPLSFETLLTISLFVPEDSIVLSTV